jgi:exodeoxyribonuclease VII small subunit
MVVPGIGRDFAGVPARRVAVPALRTADPASRAGRAFDILLQALPEIGGRPKIRNLIQAGLADGVNQPVAKKPEPQKKPDFERSLARLEEVVRRLESPQLSLDEAMKLFEEGVGLSRECQKQLEEAEGRVEILLKKADGKMVAEAFEAEGENES